MEFITPVDVTPSTGSWLDIDCSAHIPATATGVVLHLVNDTSGFSSICGIRKNGSTDTHTGYLGSESHNWAAIGVDSNRKFEAYVGNYTTIYLVGYFEDEAVFFDNAKTKNVSSADTFETFDLSSDTGADTAVAAIFIIEDSSPDAWALRKKGSSDNRYSDSNSICAFVVGLDGSERVELKAEDTGLDFHFVGYMTEGVTMNTNATDKSLGSTGSWTDIDLPAGAIGALIEVYSSSDDQDYGLRENGSSENIFYQLADKHGFGIVEADGTPKIEGKIGNTSVDFYLVGYFTATGPTNEADTRNTEISGVPEFSSRDRGIKLAKDGATIDSEDIDDYNLWTKYPPMTFLEKKTVNIEIDTTDGCPAVGTLTEQVAYDYDFVPLVIARIESDALEEKYDLPVQDIPVGGVSRCGMNHSLKLAFGYTIVEDYVNINYSAYCQSLVMGTPNECISSSIDFTIYLYFYMWELGSDWPLP